MDRLDSQTAGWSERARWEESGTDVEVPLQLTASEVADLWAWYDRVLGALGIAWVPSWHDALTLAAPVEDGATEFVIGACNYASLQFPRTSRKQLGIVGADGSITRRLITAAVDNGDGTETLTTDLAPFRTLTPGQDMLCYLRTARLAEDEVEVEWQAPDYAEARLRFTELSHGGVGSGSGRGGEETGQGSGEVVSCLMDATIWETIATYGGSFTFNSCDAVTMNGLWSVGIGGGNGELRLQVTFHGLDPNSYYTFEFDAEVTQGSYNDFFTLTMSGGSYTPAIGTGNYNAALAPALQHLATARNPDADGNLTITFGASGIEFGDSHYEMTMTNFAFALGGPVP